MQELLLFVAPVKDICGYVSSFFRLLKAAQRQIIIGLKQERRVRHHLGPHPQELLAKPDSGFLPDRDGVKLLSQRADYSGRFLVRFPNIYPERSCVGDSLCRSISQEIKIEIRNVRRIHGTPYLVASNYISVEGSHIPGFERCGCRGAVQMLVNKAVLLPERVMKLFFVIEINNVLVALQVFGQKPPQGFYGIPGAKRKPAQRGYIVSHILQDLLQGKRLQNSAIVGP